MLWALATVAWAGGVWLNGVPVPADVLTRPELAGAAVTIAAGGDVHVDAPGLTWREGQVVVVAAPPPVELVDGWWAVIEGLRLERAVVDVRVNGQLVRRVEGAGAPVLVPIDALIVGSAGNDVSVEVVSASTGARVAVTIGRGTVRSGVPRFERAPPRWVVGADVVGQRSSFTVDGPVAGR